MVIGVMAMKTTHRLLDAIIVLAMYPLALILVIVLENVAGLN